MSRYSAALDKINRILDRGGDADDVLRAVVAVLCERAGFAWARVAFFEGDDLVPGPTAGTPHEEGRLHLPVIYEGAQVAVLQVDGARDDAIGFLERVAGLISDYCLVAWDTGGVPWGEVG